MIYKATGNFRAIQILLGHTKIENTVRYLGVDIEDALELAERTEIQKNLQRRTGRCRSCTIERHHPFEGATMRRHNGHRATGRCRRKADMTQ